MMVVGSTTEESLPYSFSSRRLPTLSTSPYHDGGGVHMGGVSTLHDLLEESAHPSPQLLTMMVVGSTWEESPSSTISLRRRPTPPHTSLP